MSTKKSDRAGPRMAMTRAEKNGDYDDYSGDWKDDYIPHAIYFYYRTPKELRVYLWVTPEGQPIHPEDLDRLIINLTKNARDKGSDPRPIGWAFKDVPWWKRSYLVVALDIPNTKFDPGKAIEIVRDDGSAMGYPNHCFFDGGDGAINIPGQDPIQVMWTVNYMKNKSGKDIPPGKIHKFKLAFNTVQRSIRRRNPGDSGTNLGPPVPPPA